MRRMWLGAVLLITPALPSAAAPASAPPGEALALGRELAGTGMLATLLPTMVANETAALLGEHSELSESEQTALKATAARVAAAGSERLMAAEGRAFAQALSLAHLRELVAARRSAAAAAYRAAMPGVVAATMAEMQGLDFKADVRAAFCAETGKLCAEAE